MQQSQPDTDSRTVIEAIAKHLLLRADYNGVSLGREPIKVAALSALCETFPR